MMKAYTYIDKGHFALLEKPEPRILDPKDAIVADFGDDHPGISAITTHLS